MTRTLFISSVQKELAEARRALKIFVEMLVKGVLEERGTTGKGVSYRLTKGATKGPKGP